MDFELKVLAGARGYTNFALEELIGDAEKLYAGLNGHSFELNELPPTDALTADATEREINAQVLANNYRQDHFWESPFIGPAFRHNDNLEGATLRKLLEEFPPSSLTGITPLDKGISFRAVVAAVEKYMAENRTSLSSSIEQIKQALEELNKNGQPDNEDDEREDGESEGDGEPKPSEKKGDPKKGDKPGSGDPSPAPEDLLLFNLTPDDIAFLYAKKLLANMKTVTTGTDKVPYEDPEGVDVKYELLEDPSQLALLDPTDLANPLLLKEYAEENLYAPKRYSKGYVKRCRFLFIDNSGSMGLPGLKLGFVRAMLAHLKEGLQQDNILIVARFERNLYDYKKFDRHTPTEIESFIDTYMFAGGGQTEVGACIERAIAMAKARNFNGFRVPRDYQIELVILNDGQDHVVANTYDWPIHAICLDQHNPQLQRVCEKSKGTYHTVKM